MKCWTCIASGGYPGVCPDCGLLYGIYDPETHEVILDREGNYAPGYKFPRNR